MKDYKKILEGVVNIISTTEKSEIISNICSYIDENCPELKESEDEKIRKWLVGYFNQYATDGIEEFGNGLKVKDVIAYLEKQGESKTEPTFLFKVNYNGKEYNVRGIFGDVSLELYDESESNSNHFIYADLDDCEIIKGGYDIKESDSIDPADLSLSEHYCDCEHVGCHINCSKRWCHKLQSEVPYEKCSDKCPVYSGKQRPTKVNKAEPEFRPGDWVVCEDDYSVHQIKGCFENLNNHMYDYELTEGGHISGDNINKWHLWTLNDAKDGDILVSTVTNKPFIYNGSFDDTHVGAYCGINVLDEYSTAYPPYFWAEKKSIAPATKEQRDTLFEKMKEAGYTFDFEKKELNKITKFQVGDWIVEPREDESDVLWHIEKIENGFYWDGGSGVKIEEADKYYHIWGLEEDGKDGDILVSLYTNKPFIYNGNYDDIHVGGYCGLTFGDEFTIAYGDHLWTEKKNVRPATKERRDFLFERMKEADYRWNSFDKKVVKL